MIGERERERESSLLCWALGFIAFGELMKQNFIPFGE